MRRRLLLVAWVCFACSGAPGDVPSETDRVADSGVATGDPLADVAPEPGRLLAMSPDLPKLTGSWGMRAGTCPGKPSVILEAEDGGAGTLVILRLPDDGLVTGTYPIYVAGDSVPPVPGAVAAVQVFESTGSFGFRAWEGVVELTEAGEFVSGRLRFDLEEVSIDTAATFFGRFDRVPLDAFDSVMCAPAGSGSKKAATRSPRASALAAG